MNETRVERLIVRDILVYRFYENTRQAADDYLKLVDVDIQAHIDIGNAEKPILYVLDISRSGIFPVNYMRQRVSALVKEKQYWPKNYIAYVTDKPDESVLVDMINAITARELSHTRKVFKSDEFEKAIDWLVSIKQT